MLRFSLVLLIMTMICLTQCMFPKRVPDFPVFIQKKPIQCGPACVKMISEYHGQQADIAYFEALTNMREEGTSLLDLSDALDSLGFRTLAAKLPLERLVAEAPVPFIVHWENNHFMVVYHIRENQVWASDPRIGLRNMDIETFREGWLQSWIDEEKLSDGVVLLFEVGPDFNKRFSRSYHQFKRK